MHLACCQEHERTIPFSVFLVKLHLNSHAPTPGVLEQEGSKTASLAEQDAIFS